MAQVHGRLPGRSSNKAGKAARQILLRVVRPGKRIVLVEMNAAHRRVLCRTAAAVRGRDAAALPGVGVRYRRFSRAVLFASAWIKGCCEDPGTDLL